MGIIFSLCKRLFSHPLFCIQLILISFIIAVSPTFSYATHHNSSYSNSSGPAIPEVLKPWVNWVLHDKNKELQCIPHFNNADRLVCAWPTRLNLRLGPSGGEFSQSWEISHTTWIALPGNGRNWPGDPLVDGIPAIVVEKDNSPMVKLLPGHHIVTGSFSWQKQPEYLQIPPDTALLSLNLDGRDIPYPNLDQPGRLWLKKISQDKKIENRLQIEAFRLIDDTIPPKITIFTTLDISGSPREITLGPIYSKAGFAPLSLKCDLPAKLEQNGTLRLQVKPGRYSFTLELRKLTPLFSLSFELPDDGFWPGREIWSFVRQSNLRIVEIEGVPAIDPAQTSLPHTWKKYPAFLLQPRDTITFKEIKRGDPVPAPDQLKINRTLWLAFDGSGYTIQDSITGKKNTGWRLEMAKGITPGRISVDGKEQLITMKEGSGRPGVELRKGALNLMADSTFKIGASALSATGWDHDFREARGSLHLPPGWKLIHASGIDRIPGTWIKKWTLLDFFMVLIFTIAAARIFSIPLAITGFLTLVLTYHEPLAPRYVWPALLVGFAFLKHLPPGKLKKFIGAYQFITLIILIFIAVPYAIHALRVGIYPQLESPWTSMNTFSSKRASYKTPVPANMQEAPEMMTDSVKGYAGNAKKLARKAASPLESAIKSRSSYQNRVMQYDPKSLTQTGPGLPLWQPFETVYFNWSGPVAPGQTMHFMLIGPRTCLILAFVRVGLIILLTMGMAGAGWQKGKGIIKPNFKSMVTALLLICACTIIFNNKGICHAGEPSASIPFNNKNISHAGEPSTSIPSQQMLDELQRRLLEREDCFPACADIRDIHVYIEPEHLSLTLWVEAQIDTAIPLPGHYRHWIPRQVRLDGLPAKALFSLEETLWAMLPAGKHIITCEGGIRQQNTLQLPLPLKPHSGKVDAPGWEVQGLNADGSMDDQLQFKRIAEKTGQEQEILATGVLPSFARVERTILLGLVWKVETTVFRTSPPGSAITMNIPLIPGESVTTQGVRVKNGMVQVTMNSSQTSFHWEAFLEPADTLKLKHAKTDDWTEVWTLDVSPIFHVETRGIPVILHQAQNRWHPTWHPWPGENVTLSISRPAGIKGQTMTIEKSLLVVRPGRTSTNAELGLSIRSSKGGQHTITLPDKAELQEVIINGKLQLIRQEGRKLPLPITPGTQEIRLKWRRPQGMKQLYKTPAIDLGAPSVNAGIDIHLPTGRWPLLMGGEHLAGPAVLFWSVVIVIFIISFGLAMTGLTPLKFHHWFLLGLGMSMSNAAACLIVVAWLMVLDMREKTVGLSKGKFNLLQIGIAGLTFLAAASLVFAISQGLIGHPDMNITGNGSTGKLLRWYHDVGDPLLPRAWVFSIPMLAYRLTMLAWALWISLGVVKMVKWGWEKYTTPVIWYNIPRKKNKKTDI